MLFVIHTYPRFAETRDMNFAHKQEEVGRWCASCRRSAMLNAPCWAVDHYYRLTVGGGPPHKRTSLQYVNSYHAWNWEWSGGCLQEISVYVALSVAEVWDIPGLEKPAFLGSLPV